MNAILPFLSKSRLWLSWIAGILTLILLINNWSFYINDYVDHPQFEKFENQQFIHDLIYKQGFQENYADYPDKNSALWFKIFMFLDPIWSGSLLLLALGYIFQVKFSNWLKWVLIVLFGITWLLDFAENVLYLTDKIYGYQWLVETKKTFYAICFLALISSFTYRSWNSHFRNLGRFLAASFISLILIIIIALLLTMMDQGSSLVIHLLESPINLIGFVFFVYFLSFIFSHYPIYLWYYFFTDGGYLKNKEGKWMVSKVYFIRLISFMKQVKLEDPDKVTIEKSFAEFRYFLGNLIYVAIIYCLLFTYEKYIDPAVPKSNIIIILFILLILWNRFLTKLVSGHSGSWYRVVDSNFSYARYLSLAFFLTAVFSSYWNGWHRITFWFFLAYLAITPFIEIYDRKKRDTTSFFVFIWNIIKYLNPFISNYFLGKINYHVFQLFLVAVSGIVATIVIMLSHFQSLAPNISPLVLVLCFMHLFYGVVIISLKMYFLIRQDPKRFWKEITHVFSWKFGYRDLSLSVYCFGILLLGGLIFSAVHPSKPDAGFLDPRSSDDANVTIQDSFLQKHVRDKERYYIATYGGGLKATYYNMCLNEKYLRKVFPKTVAISGVSGGMMGQGYYYAVCKENEENRAEIIQKIGMGNFLTTDISYLIIGDHIPFLHSDRSKISLDLYWKLITGNKKNISTTAFRNYWELEDRKNPTSMDLNPALLVNCAQTKGPYGIASSIHFSNNEFRKTFPGAIDILNLPGKTTLDYFQALSTTERFPFFSSTASIEGVGHFLDGGYFENSGVLTLMNFRNMMNRRDTVSKSKDTLLIIGNGKSMFLSELLKSHWDSISKTIHLVNTTSAVLQGAFSQDKLPEYLNSLYSDTSYFPSGIPTKKIILPFICRYNDVVNLLNGNPDYKTIPMILKKIHISNRKIRNGLEKGKPLNMIGRRDAEVAWDYAYPTLARVLSRPSANYIEAVVNRELLLK
jgi:hypothetical protein